MDRRTYDEQFLLSKLAKGDEKAFNEIFDKYRLPVYAHVLSIVKSPEKAEEITQDIFVQVWSKRAELPDVNSFPDWLFIVTRNRSLSALRQVLSAQKEPPHHKSASAEDPLAALMFKETNHLLQKAIARLPARRRQIFIMSRVELKSHKEIAAALDITPGTVNLQLVQALAFIRSYLHAHQNQQNKNLSGEYIYVLLAASLLS